MSNLEDKTEYNISDIESLINNEVEESIHLDFKEADALDKGDGKKKEVSKDVSAFANSDGGIIIYGIREVNHKAFAITYIDGNIFTKEWLEQIINSSIQRRIGELKIYPIRNNGNIHECIYIVKIPKSYDAPHLCRDKRYYKRFNFESVMMEEYEIRQSYGQKLKSKLNIWAWAIGRAHENRNEGEKLIFNFEVSIFNEGEVVETNYKVNVYFTNFNHNLIEVRCDINKQHYDYTWLDEKRIKFSSDGKTAVYPKENVNAIRFDLSIPKGKIEEAFKEVEVEIILFYSNGEDKMAGNLYKAINQTTV